VHATGTNALVLYAVFEGLRVRLGYERNLLSYFEILKHEVIVLLYLKLRDNVATYRRNIMT